MINQCSLNCAVEMHKLDECCFPVVVIFVSHDAQMYRVSPCVCTMTAGICCNRPPLLSVQEEVGIEDGWMARLKMASMKCLKQKCNLKKQ